MTRDDHAHATTIEVIEQAPSEVPAGAAITVKVKAACPKGCDLAAMPIEIVAADGALVETQFTSELGRDNVAEVKLEAPARVGAHVWSVTFGPHEVEGIRHDEVTVPIPTRIVPHVTSLAVWSIPSPVVTGERFAIEVGAKSSAGLPLTAERVEVRDDAGVVVAQGHLGETPYPRTAALYWTRHRTHRSRAGRPAHLVSGVRAEKSGPTP